MTAHAPAGMSRMGFAWVLTALVGLHGCMSASRVAASLALLQQGHAAWMLGALLSLYAVAPIGLSLWAGRVADRHGFHRPVRIAVVMALLGAALPVVSMHVASLAVSGLLTGGALSVAAVAVQRQAGLIARDAHDLKRVFSWVALGPALSNSIAPVVVGLLIDHVGFRAAFMFAVLLPLLAAVATVRVPVPAPAPVNSSYTASAHSSWRSAMDLLRLPMLRNVLLVNVAMAAAWDAHTFTVPVVGHANALSASAIGLVLGSFAVASTAVRLLISAFAHRIEESKALLAAMSLCTATLVIYPWLPGAAGLAGMMVGSALLGLALGSVQPMVMSTLHQNAPPGRQGQVLGLRMLFTNAATIAMPVGFGLLAAITSPGAPMWLMAAVLVAARWPAAKVKQGGLFAATDATVSRSEGKPPTAR
jgi:MFS family permease